MDYHPTDKTIDEVIAIINKCHPKHWHCSYNIVGNNPSARYNRYVAVFVALSEDNEDWCKKNKDSDASFILHMKEKGSRYRKLPVALNYKDFRKIADKMGSVAVESYEVQRLSEVQGY
jgi:hypothetical protein